VDFEGGQFVVRTFEPPPPPRATTVPVSYVRGGGMVLRASLGRDEGTVATLLVDTGMQFPLALDDRGWQKAGVPLASLQPVPNGGRLKHGLLPQVGLGAFEIPNVPCVHGAPLEELERELAVNLDGIVGSGLLAAFRVTLAGGGRTLWLEDTGPVRPESGHPGAGASMPEAD
jgi:hypothetical protein